MLSASPTFVRTAEKERDALMLHAFERFTLSASAAWAIAAALLVAGSLLVWRRAHTRGGAFGMFARESGVVFALYGLWIYLGSRGTSAHGAYARARDVLNAERWAHLDMERPLQQAILGHHGVVQFANVFYATVHFPTMIAFLIWAFVRHRARYGGVRLRVVLVTLICLGIQFISLAPPRLLSGSGLVDTPLRYGSSVYAEGFAQVSAMPSVHVGWAVLIAWEVIRISPSRYRWWIVVHPLLTTWVVMVTGNHWLFDGLAAAAIVVLVEVFCFVGRRSVVAIRRRNVALTMPIRERELV
jgi:hypothetical protein